MSNGAMFLDPAAQPPGDVLLIRHGAVDSALCGRFVGSSDVALSGEGERQGRALAGRLAGRPVAVCLTSPLERARRTAALALPHLAAQPEPDLREIDFGAWETRSFDEVARSHPEAVERWGRFEPDFQFPGGESFSAFLARIARVAALIERRCAEGPVAAVTHGGVIRALICHWLGLPPAHYVLFEAGYASLSRVRLFGGRGVLAGLNDRCHLAAGGD